MNVAQTESRMLSRQRLGDQVGQVRTDFLEAEGFELSLRGSKT